MRFDYNGKTYCISFKRDHKMVPAPNQLEVVKMSKFPYTTANIDICQPEPLLGGRLVVVVEGWRTATVGCWHREKKFSTEKGRVRALRQITRTVPVEMKPLMWNAYNSRRFTKGKGQV